jgi:hypothetical protein
MVTQHPPSKNLQQLLLNLYQLALSHPGVKASTRLSNNLWVDLKIERGWAYLQISRTSWPTPTDWRSIQRHWPHPLTVEARAVAYQGRCYLTAAWRLEEKDQARK